MLRISRTHPLVLALILGVIAGGGLRFVPASAATTAGSSDGGAPASTACAAK